MFCDNWINTASVFMLTDEQESRKFFVIYGPSIINNEFIINFFVLKNGDFMWISFVNWKHVIVARSIYVYVDMRKISKKREKHVNSREWH